MPAHDPIEAAAFAVDSADRARQRALRYLNVFRLILGGLFLVAGEEFGLGSESPRLYLAAVVGYLAAVLTLGFPDADGNVVLVGVDRDLPLGGRLF